MPRWSKVENLIAVNSFAGNMPWRFARALGLVLLLSLLCLAIPAISFAAEPNIVIKPTLGAPGTIVTVQGAGFNEALPVNITLDGKLLATVDLPRTKSSAFETTVKIPDMPAGTYRLMATNGQASPWQSFTVVNPRLTVDPAYGKHRSIVTLRGTGFTPSALVDITMGGRNLSKATADAASGSFTTSVEVPNLPPTEHRITASDGYATASVVFTMLDPVVNINPPRGKSGTVFTIYGKGFPPDSPLTISIANVTMPAVTSANSPITLSTSTDKSGTFSVTDSFPRLPQGRKTITAWSGTAVSATTYFEILPSPPPTWVYPAALFGIAAAICIGFLVARAIRIHHKRQIGQPAPPAPSGEAGAPFERKSARPPAGEAKRAKPPERESWGTGAEPPRPSPPQEAQAAPPQAKQALERYLNLWFTSDRTDEPRIEKARALVKEKPVFLRVQIAPFDPRTLLEEAVPFVNQDALERAFPELESKPVPIDVTLFSSDFEVPETERTQQLTLLRGEPTNTLYFQLRPLSAGLGRLRVCVFYRNHMLQSLTVTAFIVAEPGKAEQPQSARVEMTFSANFVEVEKMPARGLWLGVNENAAGTHVLHLQRTGKALSRSLLSEQIENALTQAHRALLGVSFVINEQGDKISRFNKDNKPSDQDGNTLEGEALEQRFKEDMTRLASVGSNIYDAVFGTGALPAAEGEGSVSSLVDEVEKTLGDEQVIQIVRHNFRDIWPWSIMYDLAIDPKPANIKEVCMDFRGDDGRALLYSSCVNNCRYPGLRSPSPPRDKNIICPYGFWGLKHIIEQPARHARGGLFQNLALEIKTGVAPIFEMPVSVGLIEQAPGHWEEMQALKFKRLDSLTAIADAFVQPPEPHVMYFFCHGAYDPDKNPYLVVGENESIMPRDLHGWQFNWEKAHTLVFINGCHTADLQPNDLSSIMAPFVNAGAAGIIGTEVSVTTDLAGEFAENFFKRLLPDGAKSQSVGEIIRDLRLELLMRYNPLGLVYTPYCSADLRIVR